MRRGLLCLAAGVACLLAAGCGSSSHSKASSPLATELSYFSPGTPFVAALQTNSQGAAIQNAQGLLGGFPVGKLAISAVESQLLPSNLSYQSDIEPLYGNPVTLGVLAIPGHSSPARPGFLAVWITRSAAKLAAVIKAFPQLHVRGSYDGATLYRAGGSATFAVDGATLIYGSSAAGVQVALNRHAHGGGMSSADLGKATAGLSQQPLVQAFGSLTGAASSSGAAAVPWLAAVRSYGATLTASSTGLHLQFRLDTSGRSLTSGELPIAPGAAAPSVAGTLPISVGVLDPDQSFSFLEEAEHASDPTGSAHFAKAQNAAKRKTGYDLDTFAALLTGELIVESNLKTTMARAQVNEPASAAKQLAALPRVVRDIFPTASGVTRRPGGFYEVRQRHGKAVNLGLVGDQFVAGLATPAQLKAFAAAPATPVPGAQGSLAVRVSVLELVRLALKHAPPQLVQSVLATLGDVTGSVSATPQGLTGHLALALK